MNTFDPKAVLDAKKKAYDLNKDKIAKNNLSKKNSGPKSQASSFGNPNTGRFLRKV